MIATVGHLSRECWWLVVLLIMGVAFPSDVQACSCVPPPAPWQARAEADAVFAGSVIEVLRTDERLRVTFEITDAWEGELGDRVTVQTRASTASCGYPFAEDKSYLVYAYASDDVLRTNLCTRTASFGDASKDISTFEELFLGANRPEPFRGTTTIVLGLPRRMAVTLSIFDRSGRLVEIPVEGHLAGGTHRVTFDGSSLPGGVYIYRLQAEGYTRARSMVLLP